MLLYSSTVLYIQHSNTAATDPKRKIDLTIPRIYPREASSFHYRLLHGGISSDRVPHRISLVNSTLPYGRVRPLKTSQSSLLSYLILHQLNDCLRKKRKKSLLSYDLQLSHLSPPQLSKRAPRSADAGGDVCVPTQGRGAIASPLTSSLSPDCEMCSPQSASRNDMYLPCKLSHTVRDSRLAHARERDSTVHSPVPSSLNRKLRYRETAPNHRQRRKSLQIHLVHVPVQTAKRRQPHSHA